MYFFLKITSGYGSDSEITALVDQYDWKFVPIANPDGYAYTWSNVSVAIILLTLNNIMTFFSEIKFFLGPIVEEKSRFQQRVNLSRCRCQPQLSNWFWWLEW